jgi:phosphomevalonate kinase
MKERKIIIISGKQFSGKDSVAAFISKFLPDFKQVALADAIKAEFGKEKKLRISEIERNKPLYRADLIALGNKRRAEDTDYWIKKVIAEEGNIMISDVRLNYELNTFKKYGAVTIRVNSDREQRAKRGLLTNETDLTETELDTIKNWDYIIENNEDLTSLKEKVRKIVQEIEKSMYTSCS